MVILYPVNTRNKETLQGLIKKHVSPGTTIMSDGWGAYYGLDKCTFEESLQHQDTTVIPLRMQLLVMVDVLLYNYCIH